jgi:hypothetical protein
MSISHTFIQQGRPTYYNKAQLAALATYTELLPAMAGGSLHERATFTSILTLEIEFLQVLAALNAGHSIDINDGNRGMAAIYNGLFLRKAAEHARVLRNPRWELAKAGLRENEWVISNIKIGPLTAKFKSGTLTLDEVIRRRPALFFG